MINLHDAIRALDLKIVTIRGDVAYDKDENEVAYDIKKAESKLAELQEQEATQQQAQENIKASALAKLAKLGLTTDDLKALFR